MEQSAGALLSQLKEKVRDVVGFDSLSLKRKANVCFYLNQDDQDSVGNKQTKKSSIEELFQQQALKKATVKELKEFLTSVNLKPSGLKSTLIDQVEIYFKGVQ